MKKALRKETGKIDQSNLFIQIPKKPVSYFPLFDPMRRTILKIDFNFQISDFHENPPRKWDRYYSYLSDEETEAPRDVRQL